MGPVLLGRGIRVSRGDSEFRFTDAPKLLLPGVYFGLEYNGCRELGLVSASYVTVFFSSGLPLSFLSARLLPKGWVEVLPPRPLPLVLAFPLVFAARTRGDFGELRSIISGSEDGNRLPVKQVGA